MTNFEKFNKMTIREFAETRVHYDSEYASYLNDTDNDYGYDEEEYQKAVNDEIEWLNQEIK